MQFFYFDMCADLYTHLEPAWSAAKVAQTELSAAGGDDDIYYGLYPEVRKKLDAAAAVGIQVIVIAGMCLEAAIYDYAVWHLDDTYVNNHLDRLNLLSKWMVIPKLITQREIPVG